MVTYSPYVIAGAPAHEKQRFVFFFHLTFTFAALFTVCLHESLPLVSTITFFRPERAVAVVVCVLTSCRDHLYNLSINCF